MKWPGLSRPAVTPVGWPRAQFQYGTEATYHLAAAWLKDCPDVADWGGAQGFFGTCLPPTVRYTIVDGTQQGPDQVLADLSTYHEPSAGILLRHVIDHARDWRRILHNAMAAAQHRLVVVTFTPPAETTQLIEKKNGWPVWRFNPDDLRDAMISMLVHDEAVPTSHPEHIYYLERR